MIFELPDRIGFSLRFFSLTHGTKGATKMKRLLTAGIFGTILGIVGTGTANASIVSSGFLDEKLTEYALSTSLDLKANQSDFTELNTQISNSVDNLKSLWDAEIGILAYNFNPNKVNNDIEGAFGLVEGFILYSIESLTDGWTDSNDGTTYLGIKDLNTKIGPLPDDITVLHMLEGWTDSNGDPFPGLFLISLGEANVINAYDGQNTARLLVNGGPSTTIDGVDYTGPVYPLWKLSEGVDKIGSIETKIGTLPSGNFPTFPKYEDFFSNLRHPLTYPTSLAELITAIYGNSETRVNGLLSAIITGFSLDRDGDGILDSRAGLIPNLDLAKNANDLANANATKIGDLPTEYATVGAALTAIKGIAEDAKAAALAAIPDPKQEGSSGKFVLTVDIVGDNATYHWEKIDREGETTTTE